MLLLLTRVFVRGGVCMPEFLEQGLSFAREGFAEVNAVLGLLVAFVSTFLLGSWARLPFVAVGAVIAHIILERLAPVIAEVGGFHLPPLLEAHFWREAGVLFVGYLVVIGILFAIKRVVVKS
jgi:MFS superfamily sulfate permease-like transporter